MATRRRRRPAAECPNPLFVKWLEEWRDEAREEGSKLQYAYTKALNSIKKYPLPLVSGQEAKILDHIGDKLAKRLDKKLALYHADEGHCVSPTKRPKLVSTREEDGGSSTKKKKKKPSRAEYVPEYRSGPYAIIIALYQAQQKPSWVGHLSKAQLMSQAQPHSDKSFTIPDDGKYYTAWSSMATLIRKGLVDKRSSPAKFRLTEAGEEMAERLLIASSSLTATTSSTPPYGSSSSLTATTSSTPPYGSSSSLTATTSSTPPYGSSSSLTATTSSTPPYGSSSSVTASRATVVKTSSNRVIKGSPSPREPSYGHSGVCIQPTSEWNNDQDDGDMETVLDDDCCLPSVSCSSHAHSHSTNDKTHHGTLKPSPSSLSCSQDTRDTFSTRGGAASEEPIVLISDSDDGSSSDIEILPLASRVRGETEGTCLLAGSPPVPSSRAAVSDGGRWRVAETPIGGGSGGYGGRGSVGSCEGGRRREKKTSGVVSGTSSVRSGSVTPAQMSGQAALHRFERPSARGDGGHTQRPHKVDISGREKMHKKSRGYEEEEFPPVILTASLPSTSISPRLLSPRSLSSRSISSGTSSAPPSSSLPQHTSSIVSACTSGDCSSTTKSHSVAIHTDSQNQGPDVDLSTPLFQLRPGEFDVVLCVDNAESTASRKSNSQFRGILLQELAKNGVLFDVRKLNIGDFLWIAREKTAPLPGQLSLPKSREAVLEYIVERKRMDDLASSITDGRFREQRFRLRHCGVRHPIYLVEEFRDALHLKLRTRTLEQAISNVQVIDEFAVHRTTDVRDSVSYLTLLTRQLHRHYTGRTVQAFSWDTIAELNNPSHDTSRPGSSETRENSVTLAMEFNSFNEASVKNKTLTAYEMFGRHLMQVPCVSAERAALILDHFPTITALRDAYKTCSSNSERGELISSLRTGNRKLGKKIGEIICALYWGK